MMAAKRFSVGDRVELTTARCSSKAATVVASSPLDAVVQMDIDRPGRELPCLTWELRRLDPGADRGPPAWAPSPVVPRRRGRLRQGGCGRRGCAKRYR
jgi:hypothetical protein